MPPARAPSGPKKKEARSTASSAFTALKACGLSTRPYSRTFRAISSSARSTQLGRRQGAGGAGHPRPLRPRRLPLRGPQLCGDPRGAAGGRAVRRHPRRLHRRHARTGRGSSSSPTAAPSSSMRSGTCPPPMQAKLLRVAPGEHRRAPRVQRAPARGRAGHRRHPPRPPGHGRGGSFRADLFYRLNVFPLHVPPLRDRPEDIAPLAIRAVERFASRAGRQLRLADDAVRRLEAYAWPGQRPRAQQRPRARRDPRTGRPPHPRPP